MSRQHLYTGKSGQLVVMAELVSRGYNVAVPEVDIGDELEAPHVLDMNYVFAVRHRDSWRDFIIIGRDALYELHSVHAVGTEVDGRVLFTITISDNDVLCKDQSLSTYRNQWSKWPAIDHGASP